MAKKDFEKGRFTRGATKKFCSDVIVTQIAQEKRAPLTKKMGIRYNVIQTYRSKGILEAYKVLDEYNKKFDRPVYSREVFEKWISEENESYRKQGKSNGQDR